MEKVKNFINELKDLKNNIDNNVNEIIFPQKEMYRQIIEVSRKYPELKELIEFIIFISDAQNTNNELLKNAVKENFDKMIMLKIDFLKFLLEENKKGNISLTKQEKELIKSELKNEKKNIKSDKNNNINKNETNKLIYDLTVTLPKEILKIIEKIVSSKIGLFFVIGITVVFLLHYLPDETRYVINEAKKVGPVIIEKHKIITKTQKDDNNTSKGN